MSAEQPPGPLGRALGPVAQGELRLEEPLGRHSQFGVGGPARWYWEPARAERVPEVLRACRELGIPWLVLGAGSNCLISDLGFPGLVLKFAPARARHLGEGRVLLEAGAMLPRAAFDTAYLGLLDLDFGVGIPGTAGAAAWGNAGAFGGELGRVIQEVEVAGPDGSVRRLGLGELAPSYRRTALQEEGWRGAVVTRVWVQLRPGDPKEARQRVRAVMAERKATQPSGVRSLGSTFKNPEGAFAGQLLEACGLKGLRQGQAQVSQDHANFIVNLGEARADDVLALAAAMRQRVQERFGVQLELEIIPVGGPDPLPRSS
ncbi:MAG: UDP-N-acetylmuramate dehydrogenase [Candidatus Dormibacteria bacterium]